MFQAIQLRQQMPLRPSTNLLRLLRMQRQYEKQSHYAQDLIPRNLQLRDLELKTFQQEPVLGVYARQFKQLGRLARSLQALGVDVSEAALMAQQGRICEPEEVAKAALFLASDEASFVNGTHLFVDNGFTAL